ncbi:MAG TPA: lysylphosphatidylglycerol synthase domain-containing protein, partial [Longimicrobiales bacterium]|nr:lysylphosphatidylglycerol synthase domain-containing protein [Longimicrobiales bacterium]
FGLLGQELPEGVPPGSTFASRWVALYTVNWILYAFAFWVLLRSFGLPGTALEGASAFAAAYVVGYLAVFSPAGLGVREGVLTLFLAPVTGQGAAVALSILARLWTTAVEVVPAGGLWLRHVQVEGRTPEEGGRRG